MKICLLDQLIFHRLPVKNPAVMNNVAMFGATPLMMMLVAEIIEPTMATTRQPNLVTRPAAIGPIICIMPN